MNIEELLKETVVDSLKETGILPNKNKDLQHKQDSQFENKD